jgi:peptide/nickel transport system permease protein
MSMKSYLFRRLWWGLVAIFVISSVNFLIIKMVPGDPVKAIIGEYPVPETYIQEVRKAFGLDQPLYIQYVRYVGNLAQGDFGFSFANRRPVLPLILERAQYTLLLMVPAILIALVLGIGLALISVRKPNGMVDNLVSGVVVLGYSIPSFWLAQILVLTFAIGLSWLPAAGMRSVRVEATGWAGAQDLLLHMILPVFTIITFKLAVFLRVARASILGVMHDDYVATARAKGASERQVIWRHVLPNAIIPVIAVLGFHFGNALTNAILTETVFAWPGLGSLFVKAISTRDFPVLQGVLILSTVMVVTANLIADLLASLADPRIRRNLSAAHA